MTSLPRQDVASPAPAVDEFRRELSLLDSTALVAGSMIGSGIYIVSADIARLVGSPGWLLLTWVITGVLTVTAALSYGELAAMLPRAGGQYVYLREAYSPLWGFLYGWTLFLVIQSGTIAAVAVGFARFLGVLVPAISATAWIVPPIAVSSRYAVSLSTQQLAGIGMVMALTYLNTRGVRLGKLIQNTFTSAKALSLLVLIAAGIFVGWNGPVAADNFRDLWTPHGAATIQPQLFAGFPALSAASGAVGLMVALCVAQVGSLFSADAWNNITFIAGEVKRPRRTIPLSLGLGTGLVVLLYAMVNLAYLCILPIAAVQTAPDDRVATAALEAMLGGGGAALMAVAIIISTVGCNNGLILAGARVYYAMARDGVFFASTGRLNAERVPAMGLIVQGIWTAILILPRTRAVDAASGAVTYGNLYSNLLDYVVFAALVFYALTVAGLFALRRRQPDAARPYRAIGYPVVPALYIAAATAIMLVLLFYRTDTTWPGLLIVLSGIPVYLFWRQAGRASARP